MPGQPVIERAREALRGDGAGFIAANNDDATGRRYMIEPVTSSDFHVAVFGAGHVGTATVSALANLDCNIRWVDSRRKIFPSFSLPNVIAIEAEQPALEVAAMPPGSYFLIMTHSHALDFDICDNVLRREDSAYCGLIGSNSKKRRFERLLRQQQMPEALVTRLTCPIGIDGIAGNADDVAATSQSVDTITNATLAFNAVNSAIDTVSEARANVGAFVSRFEFRSQQIATSIENISAANSAIKDVDLAAEQSKLVSSQVLVQASVSALSQANQLPQTLLSLLQ